MAEKHEICNVKIDRHLSIFKISNVFFPLWFCTFSLSEQSTKTTLHQSNRSFESKDETVGLPFTIFFSFNFTVKTNRV